jgi:hypothetical protein
VVSCFRGGVLIHCIGFEALNHSFRVCRRFQWRRLSIYGYWGVSENVG